MNIRVKVLDGRVITSALFSPDAPEAEGWEPLVVGHPPVGKGFLYNSKDKTAVDDSAPAAPTQAELIAIYAQVSRDVLDARAKAYEFDNIVTAVSYADEASVPEFQRLGVAFREWRSLVYRESRLILAKVLTGQIATPTPEEYAELLPPLELEPLNPAAL